MGDRMDKRGDATIASPATDNRVDNTPVRPLMGNSGGAALTSPATDNGLGERSWTHAEDIRSPMGNSGGTALTSPAMDNPSETNITGGDNDVSSGSTLVDSTFNNQNRTFCPRG